MRVKKQRRFVPWTDIAVYGGLVLLSTGAGILAICTAQEWGLGKIIVWASMIVGFWGIVLFVILKKFFSRPDYVTKQAAKVWTADTVLGEMPKQEAMEAAFEHIALRLPELANKPQISELSLRFLIACALIEWVEEPISLVSSYGWAVRDKAGLQQGYHIMVWWQGDIQRSAFFHEMGHMIRQKLLGKKIDYNHSDKEWWEVIEQLNREFV